MIKDAREKCNWHIKSSNIELYTGGFIDEDPIEVAKFIVDLVMIKKPQNLIEHFKMKNVGNFGKFIYVGNEKINAPHKIETKKVFDKLNIPYNEQ